MNAAFTVSPAVLVVTTILTMIAALFMYARERTREHEIEEEQVCWDSGPDRSIELQRPGLPLQQGVLRCSFRLQGYAANVALLREKVVAAKAHGHPVTALITGANSGIGFALARSLSSEGVRVLLGCRNLARGNDAVAKIKAAVPGADVRLLTIDVSDPVSVLAATERLRSDDSLLGTTKHIDFLFLNAGVMPVAVKRWDVSARAFLTGRIGHFFETGRATPASPHFLQQPPDDAVACGAPSLFATHVLGHALLVEQVAAAGLLNDIAAPAAAGGAGKAAAAGEQTASRASASESKEAAGSATSLGRSSAAVAAAAAADAPGSRLGRVIWTSSRAACGPKLQWQHLEPPAAFGKPSQFEQHWLGGERRRHGETYGEAKHAADLLNAALGRKLPFPCLSICPGAVDSEIMPAFFKPFLFIFKGLRCVRGGGLPAARLGAGRLVMLVRVWRQGPACRRCRPGSAQQR